MRLGAILAAVIMLSLGLAIFPLGDPFGQTQHYYRDPETGRSCLDQGLSYVGWVIKITGFSFIWFGGLYLIFGFLEKRDPRVSISKDLRSYLLFPSLVALGMVGFMIWMNKGGLFLLIGGAKLKAIMQLIGMTGLLGPILMFIAGGLITVGEFLRRRIRRKKREKD